jgi:histidyl-tRNA synthetase
MSQPTAERRSAGYQAPRGTRDFYPEEMLRRRWTENLWREIANRHGFDEIDGPRFEHLDLYTVKSGEGIVSELFSFARQGSDTTLALRPEFTPTLARMVAAKASALPRPTKWFSVGPYFRAERPQRGRLREFLQWNVDIVGDDSVFADAELIACCVDHLAACGLTPDHVRVRISDRTIVTQLLQVAGVSRSNLTPALDLLDKREKLDDKDIAQRAADLDLDLAVYDGQAEKMRDYFTTGAAQARFKHEAHIRNPDDETEDVRITERTVDFARLRQLVYTLVAMDLTRWCTVDFSLVRGLAYYTSTVFEVHEITGTERAIAGGGRYDQLIELFGGPSTPAAGFAMGDVVLQLVLEDHGLMPDEKSLRERTGATCQVFVISAGDAAPDRLLRPVVAGLRRVGFRARHSYKATKNVGKLLKEADRAGASVAVILESETQASVKRLDTGEQDRAALSDLPTAIRRALTAINEAG